MDLNDEEKKALERAIERLNRGEVLFANECSEHGLQVPLFTAHQLAKKDLFIYSMQLDEPDERGQFTTIDQKEEQLTYEQLGERVAHHLGIRLMLGLSRRRP